MSGERPCACCGGRGTVGDMAYSRMGVFEGKCPRCGGSGDEAEARELHMGLMLRNVRSGKVWVLYGDYGDIHGRRDVWGVHRMIVSRRTRGHYVWQIKLLPATALLDPKRWVPTGEFGDAWDHRKMESDPLGPKAAGTQTQPDRAESVTQTEAGVGDE